jgi:phosphate starvation-inducible protein PhoH and related proteins
MAEALLDDIGRDEAAALYGHHDEHLRILRDALGIQLVARGTHLSVRGDDERVNQGLKLLDRLRERIRRNQPAEAHELRAWVGEYAPVLGAPAEALAQTGAPNGAAGAPATAGTPNGAGTYAGGLEIAGPLRRLKSRTTGQAAYIDALRRHDLTICIGPAGTGKTYLAVAVALEALHRQQVKRIVLVRPAVEAGEKLGFLPGDMQAKVHPFVRPLLDALREMLDYHQAKRYMEEDVIEIAPLAYMRGRTLNDAFIILDEGQNTTIPQMKMFLTRMGQNSKIVATGDVTQIDLPPGIRSGLGDAVGRLTGVPGVAVVRMGRSDIVRHPLVEAVVKAYDESEGFANGNPPPGSQFPPAPRDGDPSGA